MLPNKYPIPAQDWIHIAATKTSHLSLRNEAIFSLRRPIFRSLSGVNLEVLVQSLSANGMWDLNIPNERDVFYLISIWFWRAELFVYLFKGMKQWWRWWCDMAKQRGQLPLLRFFFSCMVHVMLQIINHTHSYVTDSMTRGVISGFINNTGNFDFKITILVLICFDMSINKTVVNLSKNGLLFQYENCKG